MNGTSKVTPADRRGRSRPGCCGRSGRPRSGIGQLKRLVFCPLELRTCHWWRAGRIERLACLGSRVTAGLGDHPNLLTLSVESGWQGRTRTDVRLINSELAYRMAHLPKLVWVVGFEPTASRFQGEDSDPAELHPETEQLEITAARTAPFDALSVDSQAHRSRVSTRIRRGSFRVVRHDGLFEQEAIPVCGTATRCLVYRLPCGQ